MRQTFYCDGYDKKIKDCVGLTPICDSNGKARACPNDVETELSFLDTLIDALID